MKMFENLEVWYKNTRPSNVSYNKLMKTGRTVIAFSQAHLKEHEFLTTHKNSNAAKINSLV